WPVLFAVLDDAPAHHFADARKPHQFLGGRPVQVDTGLAGWPALVLVRWGFRCRRLRASGAIRKERYGKRQDHQLAEPRPGRVGPHASAPFVRRHRSGYGGHVSFRLRSPMMEPAPVRGQAPREPGRNLVRRASLEETWSAARAWKKPGPPREPKA